jgi:tRNA A-37 threonylcarbamoyl transferase component Bud32
MASTQSASPARPGDPPRPPSTRRLRLPAGGLPPDADTTDYELSASTLMPPGVRLVAPDARPTTSAPLGPDARALFQQRLRLCCVVAAAPFLFFFASSAAGFIDLFSRPVVGATGVYLSGAVLVGLIGTWYALGRTGAGEPRSLDGLRAVEVAVFGVMGLFFAYWQFSLLTATPFPTGDRMPADVMARQQQYYVLAAALIVHFNWFALLVFHGVLVPNTPSRAVGVAAAMVVVAVLIDAVCVSIHEPVRRNALVLAAVAGTMLAAGAGLSIFGTAKTAALRREVETARQAIRELGQYRLRRKLGQGGMGEVYLAEHQLLKRPCAIKRIHPRYLNNPEQVARFEREVQTTATLRHPNTVDIYDYGRTDDGTFYYVMEYLAGMSLEELVGRHGPVPPERVVHVLRQVCGALKEAHRAGLVHRDIKPSNIFAIPEGVTHDQAKLLDFGLVQGGGDGEAQADGKITRDGLIVGTPEYMSPEQAQGLALDERSDLFSLGSVAYYLLTGKEAFHRENPVRTLLAVVNEEPTPLTAVNPFVPEDLAAVVGTCLAKAPDARYLRAADLEAALAKCGCAGKWADRDAADWWDRHRKPDPGTGTDLSSLPVRESAG